MMAAGTGSSAMLSETDMGNMQHYERIFNHVRSVEDENSLRVANAASKV